MTSAIPHGSRRRGTASLGIVDANRCPEGSSGGGGGCGSEAGESKNAKIPGMHDWRLITRVDCLGDCFATPCLCFLKARRQENKPIYISPIMLRPRLVGPGLDWLGFAETAALRWLR